MSCCCAKSFFRSINKTQIKRRTKRRMLDIAVPQCGTVCVPVCVPVCVFVPLCLRVFVPLCCMQLQTARKAFLIRHLGAFSSCLTLAYTQCELCPLPKLKLKRCHQSFAFLVSSVSLTLFLSLSPSHCRRSNCFDMLKAFLCCVSDFCGLRVGVCACGCVCVSVRNCESECEWFAPCSLDVFQLQFAVIKSFFTLLLLPFFLHFFLPF